jgi:hypothetical protein
MTKRLLSLVVVAMFSLVWSAWAQTSPYVVVLRVEEQDVSDANIVVLLLQSGNRVKVMEKDIDRNLTKQLQAALDRRSSATGLPTGRLQEPAAAPAAPVGSFIRAHCAKEWPDDFRMRDYCEKQQQAAVTLMEARQMTSQDRQTIRNKCEAEWPEDLRMRNYCEEKQLEALKNLQR